MGYPFHHDKDNFGLSIGESANSFAAKQGYREATLTLRGDLRGDDAFFVLLTGLPIEAASLTPDHSRRKCTFLVRAELGSNAQYSLDHFSEEIGQLVAQLKERATWRQSNQDAFLLQPTRGHRNTAYVTIKSRPGQDTRVILDILKQVTPTVSNRPKPVGTENTFLVIVPSGVTQEGLKRILRDYF